MKKSIATLFLACTGTLISQGQPNLGRPGDRPLAPTPPELITFTMGSFDLDSNYAIDLEELRTAMDKLHQNRPEPRPKLESNEERPQRRDHPPLQGLFEVNDLNQDGLLQEHELYTFFEAFERKHIASREGGRSRRGSPPPAEAHKEDK